MGKGCKRLYYSLNQFFKKKFGEPVRRIPVDAGLGCPNRDGTKGRGGCIYCDAKGSGTGLFEKGMSVEKQVRFFLEKFKKGRFKKFVVYFQSFSNTYANVEKLKKLYDVVFLDSAIVGLAIGTRADCIDEEKVKLIKEYQEKGIYVWVELGLQTIHDETLKFINRGHTFKEFLEGYWLLKKAGIPVVVHVIFGLPGETEEMMLETVKKAGELGVDGIKFHALYIVKGSRMERLYREGKYKPLELENYIRLVAEALCYLPEDVVVHRLCSEARREEIIAPLWVSEKNKVVELIRKYMEKEKLCQGLKFVKNGGKL